ncbi:MAG TPA: TIGR03435 family protein, partial [Bryobacteraceae bacterium]
MAATLAAAGALSGAESFELADVHVSPHSDNPSLRVFRRDGRYELLGATMVDLVSTAYGVALDEVSGGPSWLESDRFDVIAKIPDNATAESLKPMLRSLLSERFGLAVHEDQVLRPAFVLTAGPHPKMTQSDAQSEGRCEEQRSAHTDTVDAVFECKQVTMSAFAETLQTSRLPSALGYVAGNEVVDQTGLKGAWDFTLKWTSSGLRAKAGPDSLTLFDAIDKQLGLQLKMGQAMFPAIVVDRANR